LEGNAHKEETVGGGMEGKCNKEHTQEMEKDEKNEQGGYLCAEVRGKD
jgi:hypothetical protein